MSDLVWSGLVALVALIAAAIALVARDERRGRELSWPAVISTWGAYLLHAVLVAWVSIRAPLGRWPVPAALGWAAGGASAAAGVLMCGLAIRRFASVARMSGREADILVTSGIYAVSRNPQNVGWGLTLLGMSVAGRSMLALVLTAFFAAVVHGYLVLLEEPYLVRMFGDEYRAYRRRVARYLGLRRRPAGEAR